MLAHSWVQISISDLLFKCWNSAFLKSFYVVQKMKRSQHLKEITATNMKDVLKHGSFGLVCDPRMAKHFWISWVLNARKKQLDTSLATASEITWAFADTAGLKSQNLNCVYIEGFVHAFSCGIWMCYASLRAFPSLFSRIVYTAR